MNEKSEIDLYDAVYNLTLAIDRLADKVQELNPGTDMSMIRSYLETALERLESARQLGSTLDG